MWPHPPPSREAQKASATAVEQAHRELGFQRGEAAAQGGTRRAEGPRGAGDAAACHDLGELVQSVGARHVIPVDR